MKFLGVAAGAVLTTALRLIWKLLRLFIKVTSEIIFRFGLYVPILYLIYGAVLTGVFGLNIFGLSTDSKLYIVGFSVSIACAIAISIRTLFFCSDSKFKREKVIEYDNKKLSKNAPEPPKIYNSTVNKGIIVYEYSNRYDLYKQYEDSLVLVKTEFKKPQKTFWRRR